jgi:hypothetical protein
MGQAALIGLDASALAVYVLIGPTGSAGHFYAGAAMLRTVRIISGFSISCLVAAYAKLLFAITPAELANMPSDLASDRITEMVGLGWRIAVLFALFALPFAIVTIGLGEWRGIRRPGYYALSAIGISAVGFLSQWSSEGPGTATIVHGYALTAYVVSGVLAGLTYWLIAGRFAGQAHAGQTPVAAAVGAAPASGSGDAKGLPPAADEKITATTGSVPATGSAKA